MKYFYKLIALLLFVSFTAAGQYTGSHPNIAAFKSVSSTDTIIGFGADKAVDDTSTTWCTLLGTNPAWIQVDLGSFHYIYGFGMAFPNIIEQPASVLFQTSVDGSTWINILDVTMTGADTITHDVIGLEAMRYVRFLITPNGPVASLSQVMVYGKDIDPPGIPAVLEATNIGPEGFTANWTKRNRADGYYLVVATDYDLSNRLPGYTNLPVGDVSSFEVDGLTPATTYFYRLQAYNLNGNSDYSNVIEVSTIKYPQSIVFDDVSEKVYGDPAFDLIAAATSELPVSFSSSGDTVITISGSTATIVGAGTTVLTAIQGGDDEFDMADPVMQTIVVAVKELTVDGTVVADKAYDSGADAILSGSILVGVIGDDAVTIASATTGIFAQTGVGENIEVSTDMTLEGTSSVHYSLTQPAGLTATITAKELVATADDKSREACEVNPDFTFTYSGFAGTEDEGVVTEVPQLACAADEASPAGTYEISISGGLAANYSFTLVNGTLTINPDITPPVLTVKSISVQLDETGNASITAKDLVISATDNCAVADTTLSKNTFTSDDVGEVNVEVILTDLAGNSTSAFTKVTVIGSSSIEDFSKSGIQIYPNPTRGNLEMVFEIPADLVKVMDITGKTIMERPDPGTHESFDLSGYSNGIYIVQVRAGKELTLLKIIKK